MEINNISLIERQIKILNRNNISDIWIVTGYNSEKVKNEVKNHKVKFLFNENFKKTDTLESFFVAKNVMNDELITLYSDIIFEEKIIQNLLINNRFDITLTVEKSECREDDMKTFVENNLIKKIDKKLPNKFSNSKYTGIAKFSKNGSKLFKKYLEKFQEENTMDGDVSRIFEEIIKQKHQINANFTDNLIWFNINTSHIFKKARDFFEN